MKNIFIPNPEKLNKKILEFRKNPKSFHVVSDFDCTLTNGLIDGERNPSTFAHVRKERYLPKEYINEAYRLFYKYFPYENAKIPLKLKSKMMMEWWQKHFALMVKYGMSRKIIKHVVKSNTIQIRKGVPDFFKLLSKNKVPFLIFSAGLGDVIIEFMKQRKLLAKNVHIISNFFKFGKDGKAISYNSEIIHTCNKNEIHAMRHSYKKQIKNKSNVILLGDMIGDASMADGIKHENIIKIGFLSIDVKKNFKEYAKHYDVLILNDDSMQYVTKLVKKILTI